MILAEYTELLYAVVEESLNNDYKELFPEYNLFDNSHKDELEQKIFSHYYFYEIGLETEEMFFKQFKTRFLEIIPMANNYFKAMASPDLIKFYNDTRTRNYTLNRDNTSKSGNTKNKVSSDVTFKDTPYTSYQNDTQYNTTVTDSGSTSDFSQSTPNTFNGTDTFNETVNGLNGMTGAEAIKKYLDIVMDVDLWIIKQLRELFMEVY